MNNMKHFDVIGHELQIGDFVTGSLMNESMSLFKIVGYTSGFLGCKLRHEFVILQRVYKNIEIKIESRPGRKNYFRLGKSIINIKTDPRLLKRESAELTWVSTEQATAYLMCK